MLTQELEEQRKLFHEKKTELKNMQTEFNQNSKELTKYKEKVDNLLRDKKLLEKEIDEMQTEFTEICTKLTQMEDRDLMVRRYKEEVA